MIDLHEFNEFFADSMLGKLTRWLRLMGFSVEYADSGKSDKQIIDYCKEMRLYLLTRDKELFSRYKPSMYISSDNHKDQLRIFLESFHPVEDRYFSRCPLCNGKTEKIATGSYNGDIPEDVRSRFSSVYLCAKCGKVYWEGSHFDAILRTIRELASGK